MAFLADQYAGSKGCWVTFFGRPASAHKAIALLALDNDAPMAVGYARRLGSALHYELVVCDVADPRHVGDVAISGVRPLTEWYTAVIEAHSSAWRRTSIGGCTILEGVAAPVGSAGMKGGRA